jgi:hypothetical protein
MHRPQLALLRLSTSPTHHLPRPARHGVYYWYYTDTAQTKAFTMHACTHRQSRAFTFVPHARATRRTFLVVTSTALHITIHIVDLPRACSSTRPHIQFVSSVYAWPAWRRFFVRRMQFVSLPLALFPPLRSLMHEAIDNEPAYM